MIPCALSAHDTQYSVAKLILTGRAAFKVRDSSDECGQSKRSFIRLYFMEEAICWDFRAMVKCLSGGGTIDVVQF